MTHALEIGFLAAIVIGNVLMVVSTKPPKRKRFLRVYAAMVPLAALYALLALVVSVAVFYVVLVATVGPLLILAFGYTDFGTLHPSKWPRRKS